MNKSWYQSKTIWGALVFGVASFLLATGYLPENTYTELVRWASAVFGVYGLRTAQK